MVIKSNSPLFLNSINCTYCINLHATLSSHLTSASPGESALVPLINEPPASISTPSCCLKQNFRFKLYANNTEYFVKKIQSKVKFIYKKLSSLQVSKRLGLVLLTFQCTGAIKKTALTDIQKIYN